MENCSCGVRRKQYWLWRDTHGILHEAGSHLGNSVERSIWAINARDALLPFIEDGPPKHDVSDVDDVNVVWEGRCALLGVFGESGDGASGGQADQSDKHAPTPGAGSLAYGADANGSDRGRQRQRQQVDGE